MNKFAQFQNLSLRCLTLMLVWGSTLAPGLAAERVTVRYGVFQQSVSIQEMENFILTGELPASLALYGALLTPEQRQSLRQALQLNPDVAPQALEEMWQSPMGKRLLQMLNRVVANTSPEELLKTINRAGQMPQGLSMINFFRSFPAPNMTIDAGSVLAFKSQLETYYLKSKSLDPDLERELFVGNSLALPEDLNPALAGPLRVKRQNLSFEDRQRQRTLAAQVYTNGQTKGPLIIMIHGLGGNQNALAYLARHLASHDFTVVTLSHPDRTALSRGSNEFTLGGEIYLPAQEFIDRPRDISFVLDQLAQLNRKPGPWQHRFNTKQVTVIGQSLGGTTALTLAGAELDLESLRTTCKAVEPVGQMLSDWALCNAADLPGPTLKLSDRRVAQATLINPVIGSLFGDRGLAQVKATTLLISSTADAVSPSILNHLRPFTQLSAPKYLVTAIGATHLGINDLDNIKRNRRFRVVNERLGEQNHILQKLVRGVSLAFVQQLTPEAERYRPFLSPSYAQSLSTEAMPLRLTTELPTNLVRRLEAVLQATPVVKNQQTSLDLQPQKAKQ